MDQTTIIIIVSIFVGCFLLMIPLSLLFKKKKGKADAFKQEALQTGAVLNFYGTPIKINGSAPTKGQDYIVGGDLEKVIRLYPGTHTFTAKFTITDARLGGTKNLSTKKIEFELSLEAGIEYNVGLYDSKGEEDKTVFMQEMRSEEFIGRTKYLICEKI